MKLRVMWCGEASFLSTGFAGCSLEMLRRFHASGKYELLEYASYAPWGDRRMAETPWDVATAMPDPKDRAAVEAYESDPVNEFGALRFHDVALAFRPHVVCDWRDWWYFEHQERSPLRPLFHWAIQPTVDAEPQNPQWLATFLGADAVFTYSDWALSLLRKQGGGLMKAVASASPAADLGVYKPARDRRGLRAAYGIDPDALVLGTVQRNQSRKRYPELFEAFAAFLRDYPDVGSRCLLYVHAAWPDVGWELPSLIREFGLCGKVRMSYVCRDCGLVSAAPFSDTAAACRHCGGRADFPSTQRGAGRAQLAEVMNLFDAYVQYASSEGFGMPQVEAAACGVPVFATDYSAMADVVRRVNGFPIAVKAFYREPDTGCKRAIPDGDDFNRKLADFLRLPGPARARLGAAARRGAEGYSWDESADRWMRHLDSLDAASLESRWRSPRRVHAPAEAAPEGLGNDEFVRWGMSQVAGRPDLVNSYLAMRMTRDLNWGSTTSGGMGRSYHNEDSTVADRRRSREFTRGHAMAFMRQLCESRNRCEALRTGGDA